MSRFRVPVLFAMVALLVVAGNLGAGAATAKCTKKPFVGTVERSAEGSASGQPAAEMATADVRSALVYDFGNRKNYTVYLADYRLDPAELGGTLEATPDDVLVTVFLRAANGKDLRTGTKLVPGKDPVSLIVDAGAGARAVTSNPSGAIKILRSSNDNLCFAIRYHDDHQDVDGVVNAEISR